MVSLQAVYGAFGGTLFLGGVLDGGLSCATSDFEGRNLDLYTYSPLVGHGRFRSEVLIFLDPGVGS